jgi:hypothetical protein
MHSFCAELWKRKTPEPNCVITSIVRSSALAQEDSAGDNARQHGSQRQSDARRTQFVLVEMCGWGGTA